MWAGSVSAKTQISFFSLSSRHCFYPQDGFRHKNTRLVFRKHHGLTQNTWFGRHDHRRRWSELLLVTIKRSTGVTRTIWHRRRLSVVCTLAVRMMSWSLSCCRTLRSKASIQWQGRAFGLIVIVVRINVQQKTIQQLIKSKPSHRVRTETSPQFSPGQICSESFVLAGRLKIQTLLTTWEELRAAADGPKMSM